MMRRLHTICFSLLASFLLGNHILNAQQHVQSLSIENQIELSNQIVEGRIMTSESFWDDNRHNIYTAYTIDVYKVFKGEPLDKITIIVKGGIVDFQAEVVSHSIYPREKELGVFILNKNFREDLTLVRDLKAYVPINESQYFYKYNVEDDLAATPYDRVQGIATVLYQKITNTTHNSFLDFNKFDVTRENSNLSKGEQSVRLNPGIASFVASDNSAGTKSILTITGSNFGSMPGDGGFSDADLGGAIFTYALESQIRSWTDNEIQVEIPDYAGTGRVRVRTTSGDIDTSNNTINIDFAQTNLSYNLGNGLKDYPTQHIGNNGEGGLTWQMNTDFYNSAAKIPFENALESWSCNAGVNWKVSSATTTNNTVANDNVSIVTFSSLPPGTLGRCTSRYGACVVYNSEEDINEVLWYVTELDIEFNNSVNYNYSSNDPQPGEIDFESVAIHELGHGQQLGHVIDNPQIMHYSLQGGIAKRQLSVDDINGAINVNDRSTSMAICGQDVMIESSCYSQSLSNSDFLIEEVVSIFPNPATDYIKINSRLDIEGINIYNVNGQLVNNLSNSSDNFKIVNFKNSATGLYFLLIKTTEGVITKKLFLK